MRVEMWWEMGVADDGAVRLSVYEGGGASGGGLSVGEGLEDMTCDDGFMRFLFAGVRCSKDGRWNWTSFVLVEVYHCLLFCFTGEEGGEVAVGGDCSAEREEILPRGCLVTPQETPRLAAEWSLEHNIIALCCFRQPT